MASSIPWGNQRIGFSARAAIDREDFGLTWNQVLEAGGFLVGKRINIEIEAEATGPQAADPVDGGAGNPPPIHRMFP